MISASICPEASGYFADVTAKTPHAREVWWLASTGISKGWTLKAADTMGYLIVTSGSAQLNQTNPGLNYKIYNWGSGINTSDTGCQFAIREADVTDGIEEVRMWGNEETGKFHHSIYDTQGRLVGVPKHAGLYVTKGKKIIIK